MLPFGHSASYLWAVAVHRDPKVTKGKLVFAILDHNVFSYLNVR